MAKSLFDAESAEKLKALRIKARGKRGKRLTYDCMKAIVTTTGNDVACKAGHIFKARGPNSTKTTMVLVSVLKGHSSSECQQCPDYDGEETE